MLHCPNCGAEYEAGLLHCPYCRSVDDYQDESEYLEDLDELRDRLEDLPEDVIREQNKLQTIEAAKDLKRIFLRVALVAAGFLMIFGISVFFDRVVFGNSEAKEREREREEYLWKQENLPKLDALYESKDYEGLLAFADETDNNGIYDWEHYPLLDGLRILKFIPDEIEMVEELKAEGRTDTQQYQDDLAFLLKDRCPRRMRRLLRTCPLSIWQTWRRGLRLRPRNWKSLKKWLCATAARSIRASAKSF